MKALSLHQPWASLIACGYKRIETRSWRTRHRGPLLIVATKVSISPQRWGCLRAQYWRLPEQPPLGCAVAVCELVGCRPMAVEDEAAACTDLYPGAWAWDLRGAEAVKPAPVRGYPGLYEVSWPCT